MIRKISNLYEDYIERPGCAPDLKRIGMWLGVIIVVIIILSRM